MRWRLSQRAHAAQSGLLYGAAALLARLPPPHVRLDPRGREKKHGVPHQPPAHDGLERERRADGWHWIEPRSQDHADLARWK